MRAHPCQSRSEDRPSQFRHSRTAATAPSAFCALCRAAKRCNSRKRGKLDCKRLAIAADDRVVEQTVSRRDRLLRAERNGRTDLDAPLQHRKREIVIDADSRDVGALHDALFDGRVILDGAVPVEMIRRHVQHHADRGPQRRRQIDLKRRHLDDVKPLRCRLIERQDRATDVAAHLHVVARMAKDMRDERRRRRFAVRSGDRDERRIGRAQSPLAGEDLDVADDLDTVRLAPY